MSDTPTITRVPSDAGGFLRRGGVSKNTPVDSRNAERIIKESFGSVEEFVLTLAENYSDYLFGEDTDLTAPQIAEGLGVPLTVFLRIQQTLAFNVALDSFVVGKAYGIKERFRSARKLSDVAQGKGKRVMSPKGDVVEVDRTATEMIKADSHLRNIQGRGVDRPTGPTVGNLTVVFAQPGGDSTVQVAQATQVDRHELLTELERDALRPASGVWDDRGQAGVHVDLRSAGHDGGSYLEVGDLASGGGGASLQDSRDDFGVDGEVVQQSVRISRRPPPGAQRAYEGGGASRALPRDFELPGEQVSVPQNGAGSVGEVTLGVSEYHDDAVEAHKRSSELGLSRYLGGKPLVGGEADDE